MPGDELTVEEYDPRWTVRFTEIQELLAQLLERVPATVEHVGSTAVPGLAGKPVLDIDVVVPSVDRVAEAVRALESGGNRHRGDLGIEGRDAFEASGDIVAIHPRVHLYLVVDGSKAHLDHTLFRDALRSDADLAERYTALKHRLAPLLLDDDREAYSDAKSDFISAALTAARSAAGLAPDGEVINGLTYRWRHPENPQMIDQLVADAFDESHRDGWWARVRSRSLGWVTAHDDDVLVGFVNVATDGGAHAFILDVAVAGSHRHQGIGTHLIQAAAGRARSASCEWLHVDYEPHLADFYTGCGFAPTSAGLLHLPTRSDSGTARH